MLPQNTTADFRTLAIDQLRESETNPRRSFDEGKLQELAQSIRAQGVLVPLIVRPISDQTFEVVAGSRRFAIEKRKTADLVQISRANYRNSNSKTSEQVRTSRDYTVVEEANSCSKASGGIVVEGPGKRGEIIRILYRP